MNLPSLTFPTMASHGNREPIAVIGMAFKFPQGAETSDSFWDVLVGRKCAATEYPRDRFNIDAFWHPDLKKPNAIRTREAHFLRGDIRSFDAGFFAMAPHEVGSMDPQHRGLMETTYHAFENAGLRLQDIAGSRTSVHVGCFTSDFATMQFRDVQSMPKYNALGSAGSILANRISWFYDLRGESMYVDTACSSGLVAMALSSQALASGESSMAVVGASNIILGPEFNVSLSNMNFLSPTGRCHSFDAKGDGYGRGEGFTVIILKPVSRAISDGNPIRAVIRSIGMNQDGYTSGGITQPSKDMQVELIRETYRKANLDMRDTRFFEAHGTGTAVGDPIEARAIGEAFFKYRSRMDPIYVGAVKSNLGHLEGTSGLAGVVKSILALERGVIPPNANLETLNPRIDDEFFNLKFPTDCVSWPHPEIRRASVNSFGFGGSNAHVVLEAADTYLQTIGLQQYFKVFLTSPWGFPGHRQVKALGINTDAPATNGIENGFVNDPSDIVLQNQESRSPIPRLLVISASDQDGIKRTAQSLLGLPEGFIYGEGGIDDIVFTLNTRRTMFEWKSYCILDSSSALGKLEEMLSKPMHLSGSQSRQLGVVFTGQGAQWPRMGYELLQWPLFRTSLVNSQKYLNSLGCTWRIIDEIAAYDEASRVHIPEFSQVLCTAVQIALVDLIKFLALKVSVVIGHSSGEIAAAYCAGFLCHKSAIKVSYFRGLLSSKVAREAHSDWGMASVGLSADQMAERLAELQSQGSKDFNATQINISCMNSPTNVTLSGPLGTLDVFLSTLGSNIFQRKLQVRVGYHSPQMNMISSEYKAHLSNLQPVKNASGIKMVSSVNPGFVDRETVCSAEYWVQNMISPVRFVEAMGICCRNSSDELIKKLDGSHSQDIFTAGWLEVGPHSALKGPLREIFNEYKRGDLHYASLLARHVPADFTVLQAIGELFCQNFEVDISKTANLDARTRKPQVVIDLPHYPFNHTLIHWDESTRSREFRFRAHGDHPFLGCQTIDWNPLNAKWRFIIKKDEIPWISDHRLHGDIWYPAAGMVAMAVEAIKQLLSDDQFDVELRNVSFTGPIVVSDGPEGTETEISMVPASKIRGRETDYMFKIFLRKKDGTWDEVCDGTIAPQWTRETSGLNTRMEKEYKQRLAEAGYKSSLDECLDSIEAHEMYHKVNESTGLNYGPTFQPLRNIHYNGNGQAHATLIPFQDNTERPTKPYTIHPATLDGIFQLAIPALSNGLTVHLPTLVPARVSRLWISHSGARFDSCGSKVLNLQASFSSKRSAIVSATVFSDLDMSIRAQVDELEVTEVARNEVVRDSDQTERAICHVMNWKADPTLLEEADTAEYCSQHRNTTIIEPEKWYKDLRLMLVEFVTRALGGLRRSGKTPIPSMRKYAEWLQDTVDAYRASCQMNEAGSLLCSPAKLQPLIENLASGSRRGALNALVGRRLEEILTGELDPLQLLFGEPQQMASFYEEVNKSAQAFPMLDAYLDLWVHKDPGLKFLEIGAGTGGTTSMILDTIAHPEGGPRYSEYVFTDISESFFPIAKERFRAFDRIQYRTLDIEKDIKAQGFGQGIYDIIIAANVLHATRELIATLSNVRQLLKPNGKLLLVEMTTPDNIETGFIFGSLPGWWLGSETFRQQSAVINEDQWRDLLKQNGFSGTDQVYRDWESEVCHGWSILVSTATSAELAEPSWDLATLAMPAITLVANRSSLLQKETAKKFQDVFGSTRDIQQVTLKQAANLVDLTRRNCVLFLGLGKDNLHDIGLESFQLLQKILITSQNVLWVQSNNAGSSSPPYWAMTEGLCRVCRSENPLARIVNLTLEPLTPLSTENQARHIVKVLQVMDSEVQAEVYEPEYLEVSGRLCVNRLSQAKYLDHHIFTRTKDSVKPRKFGTGPPISMQIKTPGLLDTLEWVEDKSANTPLHPNQVEVQIQSIGVNFKECLTLLGRVDSDSLGSECSGFISRVGDHVRRFQIGDRVALGSLETYRTLVRAWEFQVVKIPPTMSFSDAAAIPTAFCTAYHSLLVVARLQKGESVLIHAAAGGTGQAAVQIAQYIGAEIFATVGSEGKRKLLIDQYGLQDDHIFYSRDSSFADGVKRMTNGRGIDVILNSLSGKLLVASWEVIAEFGRFIEIGRKDIDTRGHLPMFPFIKNALFAGVDLAAIVSGKAHSNRYILQEVFDLVGAGVLHPPFPVQPFPICHAEQAFRMLQSGKSMGKIVLEIKNSSLVPTRESEDSDYRFRSDATYVIAGGLGGIGRQICRWMARRGVTSILLLTRSKPTANQKRLKVISELEAQGVTVQCGYVDITDIESLRKTLETVSQTMPPIRGCFQAAMVIRDRPFATLTYQEWCDSILPKVHGSWNLHTALPSDLDFFIMLSSAVGIFGNSGQSNYAAGNTFQDALARYRVAHGQKSVAIDLGMILGEGFVAERKDIQDRLMRLDLLLPLSQRELFALFDYYCNPDTVYESPSAGQIITGIELPANIRKSGRDVPEALNRTLFRAMHQVIPPDTDSNSPKRQALNFEAMFEEAPTLVAAAVHVADILKNRLCTLLGIDATERTINDRMNSFGVDSLIALELRNWVSKEMRADLAVYEILGDVKVVDTGLTIAKKSKFTKAIWRDHPTT
ncbi:reducing type I polyketide synthase, partial [Xylaria scruposa]